MGPSAARAGEVAAKREGEREGSAKLKVYLSDSLSRSTRRRDVLLVRVRKMPKISMRRLKKKKGWELRVGGVGKVVVVGRSMTFGCVKLQAASCS